MTKVKIAYLNSKDANSLEFDSKAERDEKMLKHEATEHYTLEDFADAFNAEIISDLGFIVIIKEEEAEEQQEEIPVFNAKISWNKKQLVLSLGVWLKKFDLTKGDAGDYWHGFKYKGKDYDLSLYFVGQEHRTNINIYGVKDGQTDVTHCTNACIYYEKGDKSTWVTK